MPQKSFLIAPLLIILASLAMTWNFIHLVPPFEASDEAEHFLYAHHIAQNGTLPLIRAREDVTGDLPLTERWNNHTHHAPLYYLLASLTLHLTQRDDIDAYLRPNDVIFLREITDNNPNKWLHNPYAPAGDTFSTILSLRAFNLLISAITLSLIYTTAYILTRRRVPATLALLLTVTIGSFHAVHAGITNDALVMMLYSAGVLYLVRCWQHARITPRDALLLSAIVTGASLAKLTGVSLFGVAGLVIVAGVWRGRFTLKNASQVIIFMTVALLIGAGWWYARNWTLYGDPFALSATQALWGREFDSLADQLNLFEEAERLMRSFWWMVGYRHEPLMANDAWLGYASLVMLIGMIGALTSIHKATRKQRELLIMLFGVVIVVVATVLVGTRNVDISFGRLLFPALVALMPLMAWGWWRILGRGALMITLPLIAFNLTMPAQIAEFYPRLTILTPADEPLPAPTIEQVTWHDATISLENAITADIIFAGNHPNNAPLIASVVDPITQERLAYAVLYPGLAPTDSLRPDGRYQTTLRLTLNAPSVPIPPRQTDLYLRFDAPDTTPQRFDMPVMLDARYHPPTPDVLRSVTWDGSLAMLGYTLTQDVDRLHLAFIWSAVRPIAGDVTLTLQLFDAEGNFIAQADGITPAYPTSRWLVGLSFADERLFTLPDDLPAGEYALYMGWYRPTDLTRLPLNEANENDLLLLTQIVLP